MDLAQIISLALIQGLTEFLPISSSAHLILTPRVLGFVDQGLAFDVAVHLGTLAAVILYFRRELGAMIVDWLRSVAGKGMTDDARLAWAVILATVPVGIAGLLFKGVVETDLRSPVVIAATTIGFGALLYWVDRRAQRTRDEHSVSWKDALIVGAFQALALIPGTSRSGITMTAGMWLGLTRKAASRFSFLLSIPTIALSGGLLSLDLVQSAEPVDWSAFALGAALAGVTAFLCIHYFLSFIERIGMFPFFVYRLLLGLLILAVMY